MLLPTQLTPEELGYHWGMPLDPQRFPESHIQTDCRFTFINRNVNGDAYQLALLFDDDGLGCISAVAHESQDFWEEREEMEVIGEQFSQLFDQLRRETQQILGIPDFTSNNASWDYDKHGPEYTKWLGLFDYAYAVWENDESRYQIGLQKEDTELPYTITVAAMRPDDAPD